MAKQSKVRSNLERARIVYEDEGVDALLSIAGILGKTRVEALELALQWAREEEGVKASPMTRSKSDQIKGIVQMRKFRPLAIVR